MNKETQRLIDRLLMAHINDSAKVSDEAHNAAWITMRDFQAWQIAQELLRVANQVTK